MHGKETGYGRREAEGYRHFHWEYTCRIAAARLQGERRELASTHDKYPLKGSDIFTTYPLRVMVQCMRQVTDQCLCIHSWSCDHRPVRQRKQEQEEAVDYAIVGGGACLTSGPVRRRIHSSIGLTGFPQADVTSSAWWLPERVGLFILLFWSARRGRPVDCLPCMFVCLVCWASRTRLQRSAEQENSG